MKRQQNKYQCRSMEQLAVTLPRVAPGTAWQQDRQQRCSIDQPLVTEAPAMLCRSLGTVWAPKLLCRARSTGCSRRPSSTWEKFCPRAVFWMYRWGLDDLFGFPTDFLLSCDGKCCTNEKLKAQDSQPVAQSYCHRHQPSALPSSPCASCKDASHRSEWVSQGERVLQKFPYGSMERQGKAFSSNGNTASESFRSFKAGGERWKGS